MKFFLDTADIEQIQRGLDWGMVDGVTTNPSLIAKQGKPYLPTVKEIADLVPGPVSGEVLATDYEGMLEQGPGLVLTFGEGSVLGLHHAREGEVRERVLVRAVDPRPCRQVREASQ